MSVFEEEWEDYEIDKHDFDVWLDSINESGDPERDEEYYDKEMVKQADYPEVVVQSPNYTMTYSNN